ncbi:MAG: PAS domain S-box protein [Desulfobacterales bacterium]|nr:PAS domain S-box protein [Desulfobacterales bacterium]
MRRKIQILVVDDQESERKILESLLSTEPYEIAHAKDGKSAIEIAKKILPDLILLDVLLTTEMDGFEVCRQIRSNPVLAEVPIIMITMLDDKDSLLQGLEAGADDFISKPYDKIKLKSQVKVITRLNRYRLLLSERARFEKLIELSPDGILIVNSNGDIQLANPAVLQILGVSKSFIGKSILDFLPAKEQKTFGEKIKEASSDKSDAKQIITSFVRFDKETLLLECRFGYSEWNEKPAVQVVMRNITQRISQEKALKESEIKLRAITENSPDYIMTIDEEGKILYINKPIPDDISREEMIGASVYKFAAVQFRPMMKKCFKNVFATGKPDKYEIEYQSINKNRLFESLVSPVILDGNNRCLTINLRDITDRKQSEEALKTTQEEIKARTTELTEVNSAMKVLLKQRENDKVELESNVLSNVKKLIAPYIEKLKRSTLSPTQIALVSILEANLNNIISPFAGKMSSQFLSLTPMEIQIANLIKEGKSNKDMAELLGLSQNTILFHRFNIRTKLGIKNRRVNLRTYLLAYE